jgi:hypothetical protein
VFIQPPWTEYAQTEYYKRHGKIPGDLFWQGRIVKLGQRRKDSAAAAALPEVSPKSTFFNLYFNLIGL